MKIASHHHTGNLQSFTLHNDNGMGVTIINYGGAIAWIEVPDRSGEIANVMLAHDELASYIGGRFYLGAIIGRYANRIAGGRFTIDGKEYQITTNSKGNHLHGGTQRFDKKYWQPAITGTSTGPRLVLSLISPDGEEGFPGMMKVRLGYLVTDENELVIEYSAIGDRPTIINLTNHSYFNLSGTPANPILDHILTINADRFVVTDALSIPTGEIRRVCLKL